MMLLARRAAATAAPSARRNCLPVPPHVVVCGSGSSDSFGTFRAPSDDATDCGARVSPPVGIVWNGPTVVGTHRRSRAVHGSYRRNYSTTLPRQSEEKHGAAVDDVFANLSAPPLSAGLETHFSTQADPSGPVSAASVLAETASPLTDVTAAAASEFVLNTNYPSHGMMKLVTSLSEYSEVSLAVSIFAVTVSLRAGLAPLTVRALRNSSRMAHMQPEMEILTNRMNADPRTKTDPAAQKNYQAQMKAIFQKYDCNPLKSMVVPLVQMPVFMSMFFGLRALPDYFPEVTASGGHFWFQDLTLSDPYYILPFITSATFLCMVEMGADGMAAQAQTDQQKMMKNVMRGLGVMMFPLTAHFPAAVFCYWVPNNFVSLGQTVLLTKVPGIKAKLGIWDPPKPPPGAPQPAGIIDQLKQGLEKMTGEDPAAAGYQGGVVAEHAAQRRAEREASRTSVSIEDPPVNKNGGAVRTRRKRGVRRRRK